MGAQPFPDVLALHLASVHGATAFVETGTYYGERAAWAAHHFEQVYTVELDPDLAYDARERLALARLTNVACFCGDSRRVLPGIVRALYGRRAVYWLDGHWSGKGTAGEHDQCPLLGELACLSDDSIVMIDDARLFIRVPFAPLDVTQWPTLQEVLAAIPPAMFVQIVGDVIFAVPASLRAAMTEFLYSGQSASSQGIVSCVA